jgi:molybdopterin converting factor small subunit
MPVTFRIPNYLAAFAGNSSTVKLDGSPATVRDALEALWRLHPGLRDRLVDEQGGVRQHVNIFVGDDAIRLGDGLSTPVPADAEILIVPAVSGG